MERGAPYWAALAQRLRAVIRDRGVSWTDVATLGALTALATALRLYNLGSVPDGLHGDEAWTGLDARRILAEGWIGPYVTSAIGQPTGPLYLAAAALWAFPDTTFTLRATMALLGAATIPVAWATFAYMFNRTTATFAAVLLCVMPWHLHLSRTAFMVTSWPLMELLALWALWAALRRRSYALTVVAGLIAGAGVYSYNVYLLTLPLFAIPWAWELLREDDRGERLRIGVRLLGYVASAVLVALPLITYIASNTDTYRMHQRIVGVQYSREWKESGVGGKAELLAERAWEWQRALVAGGRPDLGDGLATERHPVVDPVTYALAIVGFAVALTRIRRGEYAVLVIAPFVLVWGALLTVEDGLFRRTLGMAPFIAVLAAIPLAGAWEWSRAQPRDDRWRTLAAAAVLAVPAYAGVTGVWAYFGPVQESRTMRFVYPRELDAASRFMRDLPPGTPVYFYSDRWSFNYETRRFIAPDVEGVDRSLRFRRAVVSPDVEFSRDPSRPAAFVLLDAYLDRMPDVEGAYPGGAASESRRGDDVMFRAYVVPAAP